MLQMTLVISPPGNCVLVGSPPTLIKTDLCNEWDFAEMRECDSQGWDLRTTVASILLSWITLSEGSQIICYGDTQGGLW